MNVCRRSGRVAAAAAIGHNGNMQRFTLPVAARILAMEKDNYRTQTFTLAARLTAQPGQFVMAWQPRFDEKPFSLVAADPVTLMITAVGPFTQLAHTLRPGDSLWIRGAFGNGFCVAPEQRHLALVGGGYGVAPLLWLARQQLAAGRQVTVVVGARTAADLLYLDRFEQLTATAPAGMLTLRVATEDGSLGHAGRVTDVLAPLISAGHVDGLYACGPHGMLDAVEKLARQAKVACQASWEAYMRCGLGICGSCEHAGKILCLDGPVLSATS